MLRDARDVVPTAVLPLEIFHYNMSDVLLGRSVLRYNGLCLSRRTLAQGDIIAVAAQLGKAADKHRQPVVSQRRVVDISVARGEIGIDFHKVEPSVVVVADVIQHCFAQRFLVVVIADVSANAVEITEPVAARRKRERRFHLSDADHQLARLAQTDSEPREVAVACYQHKAVDVTGIQDIHSVDYHREVRRILPRNVAVLLNGHDRVVHGGNSPARVVLFPVAVNSLDYQLTVL